MFGHTNGNVPIIILYFLIHNAPSYPQQKEMKIFFSFFLSLFFFLKKKNFVMQVCHYVAVSCMLILWCLDHVTDFFVANLFHCICHTIGSIL